MWLQVEIEGIVFERRGEFDWAEDVAGEWKAGRGYKPGSWAEGFKKGLGSTWVSDLGPI